MTSSHQRPLRVGLHVLQMAHKEKRPRESKGPHKVRRSPIESATRLHEVGIASNRRSECYGTYVPGLVHTARHTMEWVAKEVGSLTFGRALTTL